MYNRMIKRSQWSGIAEKIRETHTVCLDDAEITRNAIACYDFEWTIMHKESSQTIVLMTDLQYMTTFSKLVADIKNHYPVYRNARIQTGQIRDRDVVYTELIRQINKEGNGNERKGNSSEDVCGRQEKTV